MARKISWVILAVIILLIILAGVFGFRYFVSNKENNYIIKNKYYSFELKAPKNWVAEENTSYSPEIADKLMGECNNKNIDKASSYQIGAFKFKDQKYPQDFGASGNFSGDFPTGAIFEITISCVPNYMANKVANYGYGNLKVGGERAAEEFLNLPGFGKTKYLSFFHNNIWYEANEYIYVSPADKNKNETGIRDNYNNIFNNIISSFKFVK